MGEAGRDQTPLQAHGYELEPPASGPPGGDPRQILKRICEILKGPVSAEVVATDAAGMVREGRDLATIDEHIVVKVPFTKDGVKACKTLAANQLWRLLNTRS